MLEFLTVLLSSLAIIWARKADLQRQLSESQSREQLVASLRHPTDTLTANLSWFQSLIARFIGAGVRILGFCLATSLSASAISFLFAVVSSSGSIDKLYLPYHTQFKDYQRLLFGFVLLAATALFSLARYRSTPALSSSPTLLPLTKVRKRLQGREVWYHLSGALILVFSVEITYNNYLLSVVTLVIAAGAAVSANPNISNRVLMNEARLSVAIGAALGVLGFTVAIFSFTSATLPRNIWLATIRERGIVVYHRALMEVWGSSR